MMEVLDTEEDGRDTRPELATWSGFLVQIEMCFGTPYRREMAESRLQMLRQGNRTAEEFWWEFRAEADLTDLNDSAKLIFFKQALSEGLYREIRRQNPPPVTLHEWSDKAVQLDRQWRQFREEERLFFGARRENSGQPSLRQNRTTPLFTQTTPVQGTAFRHQTMNLPQGGQPQRRHVFPVPPGPPPYYFPRNPQPQRVNTRSFSGGPMDVDRNKWPPLRCFKCGGLSHFARECRTCIDLRLMTQASPPTEQGIAKIEEEIDGQKAPQGFVEGFQ
jgi:hypothetical protein